MKKFYLLALGLATAGLASAEGLDLQSRINLQRERIERADMAPGPKGKKSAKEKLNKANILGFALLNDGYAKEDLEETGLKVLSERGGVYIVSVPMDKAEEISMQPCVKKLSLERQLKTNLMEARKDGHVDEIHEGKGLDVPYTGKGVLTMLVDQGVDPNHVAFLDENGESRVVYLSDYSGYVINNEPEVDYFGKDILDPTDPDGQKYVPPVSEYFTDVVDAYHGTHTMNILAGNYRGEVEMPDWDNISASGKARMKKAPNPYYGIATDAEIAVSCGSLADACIAYGINGLLDYAAYRNNQDGMPSVLSLSLGATTGPHDPKNLMNYFLELCGEETIIVLAAGNEGDLKIALTKELTADQNRFGTMIYPFGFRYDPASPYPAGTYNTYVRNGVVMIYADDDRPFTIEGFIMTGEEGNYRKRTTFSIDSQEGNYYLSNNYYQQLVGGSVNSTVAKYFDGFVGGGVMLDETLGRYYGAFDYYLYTNPETGFNPDGSEGVIVGFEVIGQDGQRIECYCDGLNTWMYNYGMEAYMDGQRDGTISDMAVGNNVLVVGAYNTTNSWFNLDGNMSWYNEEDGFVLGDMGQYTSYGTLKDGRTLPHVVAPGSAIISAISKPYVDVTLKDYAQYVPTATQAVAEYNGEKYYFKEETGTSMSTPFVAGSIALWLEADPSLRYADVMDIISKTSRRDEFVVNGNPAQWGYGKFDALAGLKEVIARRTNGVEGIVTDSDNNRLIFTQTGAGQYDVFVGDAANLDVKVYSISGNLVFSNRFAGNSASLNLSDLAKGVYAISVNGHSKKVMIK